MKDLGKLYVEELATPGVIVLSVHLKKDDLGHDQLINSICRLFGVNPSVKSLPVETNFDFNIDPRSPYQHERDMLMSVGFPIANTVYQYLRK